MFRTKSYDEGEREGFAFACNMTQSELVYVCAEFLAED